MVGGYVYQEGEERNHGGAIFCSSSCRLRITLAGEQKYADEPVLIEAWRQEI